jgi:signal transduction histidine kinase
MAQKLNERDKSLKISHLQLTELNKSYLDLVSFVSHELKGILASTILNAYTVRDGFLGLVNFKQRKALDSITTNLDYLSTTVVNFLNLSRFEKGEMEIHRVLINLKKNVLDPSMEAFAKLATERNISYTLRADDGITINADEGLLQVVANNLISNAIKYCSDNGKVEVIVSANEKTVQIEVYNDGRPLTAEETGKLFKRFSRLDAPETKKAKGTGLGLFISKQIIEKHGGSIRIEPKSNGNAFIFTLERGN